MQKQKLKKFVSAANLAVFVVMATVGMFGLNNTAKAADANQVLGQLDINGLPVFTQKKINSGEAAVNDHGFDFPIGLEVDAVGHRLFVADSRNHRVLIFNLDLNNNLVDYTADNVLGQADFVSGDLNNGIATAHTLTSPRGIAFDSLHNLLYVSDSSNNRVVVFDTTVITNGEDAINVLGKTVLDSQESAGTAINKFWEPRGIAYNSSNKNLAIADGHNSRVVIYDLNVITNGEDAINVLGQADFDSRQRNRGGAVSAGTLDGPYALTYNTTDNFLYVVDYGSSRGVVYDLTSITNGEDAVNVLGQIDFNGSAGNQGLFEGDPEDEISRATAGTLYLLQGAYYDNTKDVLYVADGFNNRVLRFSLLKLTSAVLSPGNVGVQYNETLAVQNAQGTVRYSVESGNLPNGLTLDQETGAISGVPTALGNTVFTVKATDTFADGSTFSDTKEFNIEIAQNLVLPATVLANGLADAAYNQSINPAINGRPGEIVTYTVTDGNWPNGLNLNGLTGEITGVPTTPGNYTFTITATDSFTSDSEIFTIKVLTLDLIRTLLPSGVVGAGYDQSINAAINTQGNVVYEITAGALPDGLVLVDRRIGGIPTTPGVANFTITATDALGHSDSADFTITIDGNDFSLPFIPLEDGLAGAPYDQTIPAAINALGKVTYSVGAGLPPGLSFDTDPESPTFRHIKGVPEQVPLAQDFTFDITAADEDPANLPDTETFTIHIEPALELPVTIFPSQVVGFAYVKAINPPTHVRGAVSYSVVGGNLPDGLSLDAVTGIISGTLTAAGVFNFTIQAKDVGVLTYTATQDYTITILAPISLPATVFPNGTVGSGYNQTVNAAVNGQGAITYAVTAGNLPNGLVFDAATRVISGNPTTAGTFNFTIIAIDAANFDDSQDLTIMINPAPVAPQTGGGGGGGGTPVFTAPVGGFSVAVESIVPNTNPTQVNLRLNGGTATRMAISNTTDFAGVSQQAYSPTALFTLSPGVGSKTVYVRFYNSFGAQSPVVSANLTVEGAVIPPTTGGEVLGEKITRLDTLIAKLKFGQTSNEVMELQTELKNAGYFAKSFKTTKYYGAMTKAAVAKYLANKNKQPAAPMTLAELVKTLKFGQKSELVKQLQTELKKVGFLPRNHAVTNYYGLITKAAVNKYLVSKK